MRGIRATCCATFAVAAIGFAVAPMAAGQQPTPGTAPAAAPGPIDYGTARLDRKVQAARATGEIRLDGVLDESAWADAPMANHFIQNEPREGA